MTTIRKTFTTLLILAFVATFAITSHAEAVDELLDNASDPNHIDHHAGVTQQDIIDAHMESGEAIGVKNVHREIKQLKKRIQNFEENPEELTEEQKAHLINRAQALEQLKNTNDELHEEINEIMEGLASLNTAGDDTDL